MLRWIAEALARSSIGPSRIPMRHGEAAERKARVSRAPNTAFIEEALSHSPTWDMVERWLEPGSKARMLRWVAEALARGGHLYERPERTPAPLPRRARESRTSNARRRGSIETSP